jgi:hypothetical protein
VVNISGEVNSLLEDAWKHVANTSGDFTVSLKNTSELSYKPQHHTSGEFLSSQENTLKHSEPDF